jgi:hypothetical protein
MSSTPLPWPQRQLGRNVGLLVELRLLQAVARVGEVGAAVLQVRVEEEPVEIVAEIIMVRDVAARAALPVEP